MSAKTRFEAWAYSLFKCVIGGAAATGSTWMGLAMGKQIGLDVPVLNFKSLGVILACSSLSNLFFYLKENPLPPQSDGNTETFTKNEKTN